MNARALQIWNGWIVDERLREFRRVSWDDDGPEMEIVSFDSERGQEMFSALSDEILYDEVDADDYET